MNIDQVYQELDLLSVALEMTPELGPTHLREKLLECRRKQDRISKVLVDVNREFSSARARVRALQALVDVARGNSDSPTLKAELRGARDVEDQLRYCERAVRLRRENLRATSSDIRLLVNVIEQQIKLGEVQPPPKAGPREVNEVLPFMVDDAPREMSFDSEWPDVPAVKKKTKQPTLIDDTVDVEGIF